MCTQGSIFGYFSGKCQECEKNATRLEPKTSLLQRVSFRIEATGNALKNRWKLLGELVPNGIVPFFTDEAK